MVQTVKTGKKLAKKLAKLDGVLPRLIEYDPISLTLVIRS